MRTPKKVILDIHEEAKEKADSFERTINDEKKDYLQQQYSREYSEPDWYGPYYKAWRVNRAKYIEQNFQPTTISAEDRGQAAKNFRIEAYLNMVRRGIATVLISTPLIFSAGSCVSCAGDPAYEASNKQNSQLNDLYWDIDNVRDFLRDAEIDSSKSLPFKATSEEVSVMKKRLENLTNYRDSVKNSPEYARIEEASDSVGAKGWRKYLAGIAGAIGMGFLSFYLGKVTEKQRQRKNDNIQKKYLPQEAK